MARTMTKPIGPGSRVSLGLKVTYETYLAINGAAQVSGRTQSQEAEYRLQASFDQDRLVTRILEVVGR